MDNFYEQLVYEKDLTIYKIVNALFYIFAAISVITLFDIMLFFMISLIICIACFLLKMRLYVEYEYAFTNGSIDVDVIYEAKRRKRKLSFDMSEVELIASNESSYVKDFLNKPEKCMKCYTRSSKGKIYTAIVTCASERVQLEFAPDSKFINLCFKYNSMAVKRE